ncbi:MAG: 2-hydroxyacyl-CoA dehydratase [Peptococcaceae bacterium]|nr:2-hydroxyacyl-CoA dehydratase [Peptococcaceae bacterium]
MKIGLTTTVPVEAVFAAGHTPVDINNIFISDADPMGLVEEAELAGYPRNVCGWIKGLYTTVLRSTDIRTIIAVTQGDCSNTHALMETWQVKGIEIIPFAFPYDRDYDMLQLQMDKLVKALGTTWGELKAWKTKLDKLRGLAWELDRLTWQENKATGFENHLWQVSCSDFNGEPHTFGCQLESLITELKTRQPLAEGLRLGFIGVPPIFPDIYDYLESMGARVVFNEVQRQFTLPFRVEDIVEQYRLYTYPYNVFGRIEDIKQEIERRRLDGIIHYTQSFCFRQIEDIIIRQQLGVPILSLEGDNPSGLDARSKMRIEAFVEMLK